MSAVKILIYVALTVIILLLLFLLYFTFTQYSPEKEQVIERTDNPDVVKKDTFSMLIWNIGYCGLGEKMSFFYDGGTKVRSSREETIQNFQNIIGELDYFRYVDYILLQEVDISSKRSYYINQFRHFESQFREFNGCFAMNYRVQFVPVPVTSPLGKVKSGIATFSRYIPEQVVRYDFPGSYPWPKQLFMLDRCFLLSRFQLNNGADLLVVNTHNSAYDKGDLKKQEMQFLKEFLTDEYQKGNYIIVGGDWNQYPPGIDSLQAIEDRYALDQASVIDEEFMPEGWRWAYDASTPTNRALDKPYNDTTQTNVIDYYLLSPNVVSLHVKTIDLDFVNSDHQPVVIRFKVK